MFWKYAGINRRTPMLKCDFNKVAKQFYWNRTSAWVPVNFLHIFRTPFLNNTYGWLLLNNTFPHEKMGCNFVWNVLSQKRNINSGKLLIAFFPDFWIKRGKLLMVFPQTFHINVVTRSFEIQYVHELESTKIWPGDEYFKPGKPRFLERQFSW